MLVADILGTDFWKEMKSVKTREYSTKRKNVEL